LFAAPKDEQMIDTLLEGDRGGNGAMKLIIEIGQNIDVRILPRDVMNGLAGAARARD
jgi:hypothetical protein